MIKVKFFQLSLTPDLVRPNGKLIVRHSDNVLNYSDFTVYKLIFKNGVVSDQVTLQRGVYSHSHIGESINDICKRIESSLDYDGHPWFGLEALTL